MAEDSPLPTPIEPKSEYVVFFHYPCQDGLCSAWIAQKYFSSCGIEVSLVPYQHGSDKYPDVTGKHFISLDCCPPKEILELYESKACSMLVIDHHRTNEEILKDKPYSVFDLNMSGAGLTWMHFFKGEPMPLFIEMIQDRDIWTKKVENSFNFTEAFYMKISSSPPLDFDTKFKVIDELFDDERNETTRHTLLNFYIQFGIMSNEYKESKLIRCCSAALRRVRPFRGLRVCMYNCEHDIVSDLGNKLTGSGKCDVAVLWRYNHSDDVYYVSMRSRGAIDVSAICKSFDSKGGGHTNAAGFTTKTHPVELFTDVGE